MVLSPEHVGPAGLPQEAVAGGHPDGVPGGVFLSNVLSCSGDVFQKLEPKHLISQPMGMVYDGNNVKRKVKNKIFHLARKEVFINTFEDLRQKKKPINGREDLSKSCY